MFPDNWAYMNQSYIGLAFATLFQSVIIAMDKELNGLNKPDWFIWFLKCGIFKLKFPSKPKLSWKYLPRWSYL